MAHSTGQLSPHDFSFSKYNFILDAGSKATLLRYDAAVQMQAQYRDSLLANGMNERAGYLVLEVNRVNLIADTMRGLANKSPQDLKKPLKIHFKGVMGHRRRERSRRLGESLQVRAAVRRVRAGEESAACQSRRLSIAALHRVCGGAGAQAFPPLRAWNSSSAARIDFDFRRTRGVVSIRGRIHEGLADVRAHTARTAERGNRRQSCDAERSSICTLLLSD
jgi:hypothetical protein